MTPGTRRGRTRLGRERAQRQIELARPSGRRLLRGVDHGEAIVVRPADVGAGKRNDRWVEPFLDANRAQLRRLALGCEVAYQGEVILRLRPAERIGAAALLSPSTRKVTAGVVISPRFDWSALADVTARVGFSVEPKIGGAYLVPGSARDVPAWLIAGPVLRRLAAFLRRRRRTFVEERAVRTTPRGRIEWNAYAQRSIGTGRWHHLPCVYSGPEDDPRLLANVRWTLDRVADSLSSLAPTPMGRSLLDTTDELLLTVGPGPRVRPERDAGGFGGELLLEAFEAMSWIAEERGLGGARTLDGLAWDLAVDTLWESWVANVMETIGPRYGFGVRAGSQTRRLLDWRGPFRSMHALIPDVEMTSRDRVVWVDAKYKAHLLLLARKNFRNLADDVREAHRADLHQALAYASLSNLARVDTVLVYPVASEDEERGMQFSVATVTSGRRRVRLLLAGLPFGFRSPTHEARVAEEWGDFLREA
ncbi:MAG TPA: hypothetical protein VGH28_29665 [Polyangiaceae bacterium]|jgi:hypothetical protein